MTAKDGRIAERKRYKLIRKSLQNKGLLPAATDTGLVTVKPLDWRKYRNGDAETVTPFGEVYTAYVNGYWRITRNGKAGKFIKATGGDDVEAAKAGAQADFDANVLPLVRSQADELLAAERAKYRDAMEKLVESQRETLVWQQRAIDLKADNAALTARVEELEERARQDAVIISDFANDVRDLKSDLARINGCAQKYKQHKEALEADNAAKDARIKMQDQEISDQSDLIASLEAKLADAEEVAQLVIQAEEDKSGDPNFYVLLMQTAYDKARAVLGGNQ